MKIKCITIVFFVFLQSMIAQVKTQEVLALFSKTGEITWEVSLSDGQKIPLRWQERPNSIKGIKTFVCYQNDQMIGVLSVDSQGVSGNLKLSDKSYNITSQNHKVIFEQEATKKGKCGTCCGSGEHLHEAHLMPLPQEMLRQENEVFKLHSVHSDGVLRVYRLALLITYKYFLNKFGQDVQEVQKFWASTEVFLNELYHRDVSVRFEIVNDERLIYKTWSADPFYYIRRATQIHDMGTAEINKLIPENDYDVGVVIHPEIQNIYGLGATGGVYEKKRKALCFAVASKSTIAHEIGHLFGSLHTFTSGGSQTYYSEPNNGMSVMGYNSRSTGDYFSLVSIAVMRKRLSSIGYYTDQERTQLTKGVEHIEGITNVPYGIKPRNTAPIINTAKIKKEYTLPHSTFFQFYIPAKDAEQQKLYYYAHQVGGKNFPYFTDGSAKFLALKSTQTGRVAFERSYYRKDLSLVQNSPPSVMGTYDFWLAVNDADTSNENHGVYYDQAYTKVNIIQGTPFKITNGYKKKYTAGEKVTFTWNVDHAIFNDTKVRILMSDDFGETYKYTLVASAPNNGSAEVTIPHITLGRKPQFGTITSGLGIIKIEVIDHIAHDITDNNPNEGGFEIEPSVITFQNTPEPTMEVKEGQIPQKADVTAVSTCRGSHTIVPTYNEQVTDTLIVRTWQVTDSCGNKAQFVQHIHVQKDMPLSFVETLPYDQNISYGQPTPVAVTLTATGGCSTPQVQFSEIEQQTDCRKVITRIWTATGTCSEPISHRQIITITDDIPPVIFGSLPENVIHVPDENQIPYQESILVIDSNSKNKRNDGRPFTMEKMPEERQYDSNGRLTKVIYKWRTNDFCGNVFEFVQTINVGANNSQQPIAFVNFQDNINVSCENQIPTAQTQLTISDCNGVTQMVSVTHTDSSLTGDCKNQRTFQRTYTATACGQTISQVQTISIAGDREKPRFEGTLPSDISVNENDSIPAQEDLTATDNCSQNVVVTKNRTQNGNTITDTWTATDNCGNTATHSRTITIVPVMRSVHFSNFPANQSLPCGSSIPTALTTIEITGCSGVQSVNVSHSDQETGDCQTGKTITRTYTAVACNQTISQVQTITIAGDREKPTFNGTLPSDISVNENDSIPAQEDLTATDNCSQNVVVTKNRTQNGNTITDTWTATDDCGNTSTHSRTITLLLTPSQGGNTPSIRPKVPIYNVVSLGVSSENYLRIEPIEDFKDIDVQVFSELGDKVFESRDYQRTGKVFRGYANVSGVFGTGKRLPSGTYFYIMKYKDKQGKNHTQTGYLLVR